jgi:multidrug resistance efflux pump
VTNLLTRLGDYARVGEMVISVVDAESFWVDGYFEETKLGSIHEGDPAKVKLMRLRPDHSWPGGQYWTRYQRS